MMFGAAEPWRRLLSRLIILCVLWNTERIRTTIKQTRDEYFESRIYSTHFKNAFRMANTFGEQQ